MEYLLLKYGHLLAFVYWLGGDLGTFLSSRQLIRRDLGTEARAIALKIMLACDQGPKLAMPLIFPLGFHLASITGMIQASGWLVALVWLLGIAWTGWVLALHLYQGKPVTRWLTPLDFYFRIGVVIALLGLAAQYWLEYGVVNAQWIAWKIVIFAALVACGLLIRVNLKPFVAAFSQMMQSGATDATDSAMEKAIGRCRPWVWAIWLGLFVNAALGLHIL